MARAERTVREAVQPLPNKVIKGGQLAVADVAENINISGMEEARQVYVYTFGGAVGGIRIGFDVGADDALDDTNSIIIPQGETVTLRNIVVTTRIRWINYTAAERPNISLIAWGV